uniref:THUMP domain-containing class I SAM-dependent RNA methyltransferase n=1 Tax=Flavobacterium sp. TaxID=239 RepID=UPI0040498BEB
MENFKMIAKTFFGFEEILAKELAQIGAQNVKIGTRSVSFSGDKGFMYKANLCLRTALKVLKPIHEAKVFNDQNLYDEIQKIDWSLYMNEHQSFLVNVTMYSEVFNQTMFVALKTKDAIVDQFREKTGKRPNIDKDFPDLRVHVHLDREFCTVSVDTSGESLHQRGYRSATNIAPINEVLAAGILLLSGWDGSSDFLDPMCGSGTLLIEAAMIACNIPANINRKEFAFERWLDWEPELFDMIVNSLMKKTKDFHYSILGYDKAPSAVNKALTNVQNANLDDYIKIEKADFFSTVKQTQGPLHMVFNPPYGERLDIDEERFYREIGDTFKQHYPNTKAWFITANLDALKFVGLKPSRKIKLFNGKLEARLVNYQIYEGSKRAKFQTDL